MAEDTKPEVGHFRTMSGLVLDLHLPLAENLAHQELRGELVRVKPDGSALDDAPSVPVMPAGNASKNAWVGYAVSLGVDVNDADAMTRNDLVEKFGKK